MAPGAPISSMPQKMAGKKILVLLVVVFVLLFVFLLVFQSPANAPNQPQASPHATQNQQQSLGSSSDEVNAIDQDLNSTNLGDLDSDLNNIGGEFQ